ncbi:MAG: hypothetical protein IJS29_06315 [Selenomonadaceae bacterium]|nr:hypothetical protein [Selenomonadaceae bacterium]
MDLNFENDAEGRANLLKFCRLAIPLQKFIREYFGKNSAVIVGYDATQICPNSYDEFFSENNVKKKLREFSLDEW